MSKNCQAKVIGDQMVCGVCHTAWDLNDPDRPACRRGALALAEAAAPLVQTPVGQWPAELPASVAAEMNLAYRVNGLGLDGMRAAYRLLLDRMASI